MSDHIDLGAGYSARFYRWRPDRSIRSNAEEYAGVPDVDRAGVIIACPHGESGVRFYIPGHAVFGDPARGWAVESYEPLTLTPSILMRCGCHGWIRSGRWQAA